jgi:signal transduction histidine kinase
MSDSSLNPSAHSPVASAPSASSLDAGAEKEAGVNRARKGMLVETRISLLEVGIIFGAWAVILVVPLVSVLMGSCCGRDNPPQASVIVASLLTNMLPWVIATIPVFWMCRQLHPDERGWGRTVVGHIIMGFAVLYIAELSKNVALSNVQTMVDVGQHVRSFTTDPVSVLTSLSFLSGLPAYLLLVVISLGRDAYLRYRDRRDQAEQLELETRQLRAQLTEARLQTLRMQINPHFLFNTLHTVSTMAGRDPDGVRRAIARLSEMLRYALSTSDRQEVPLDEEIAFLESYLAIQKLRLNERLAVTLDIDPTVRQALVPTLLLQPLAENAVKHGFEGSNETGHLCVRAQPEGDRLMIEVMDDGRGIDDPSDLPELGSIEEASGDESSHPAEQHGLRNVAMRLRGLYGTGAEWMFKPSEGGGLHVTLRMPLHTQTPEHTLRLSGVVAE